MSMPLVIFAVIVIWGYRKGQIGLAYVLSAMLLGVFLVCSSWWGPIHDGVSNVTSAIDSTTSELGR
ncbi:MAG TPA: hypothetical protein VGJ13_00495 [Pseudonocardiaceae bacterium]|jgi:hypothetical protein